jgi:WD40 repeat protein
MDGRAIIVCGYADGVIRSWDLASADPYPPRPDQHDGWVSALALGRLSDRPVLVSVGGYDQLVRVSDLRDASPLHHFRVGHPSGRRVHLAVGEAGNRPVALTAGADGILRRWGLADGQLLDEVVVAGGQEVVGLTCPEPDTALVATGSGLALLEWYG